MWGLGLSVFLALSGVSVVDSPRDCRDQPGLMGGYIKGTNLIELCHANVNRADQDLERVLRHEIVHAIQENFDLRESLIPEPLLTWLVRWTMDDREVMTVLLYDEHETDQEFEARLLANLPNWVVGSLLWISEHRHRAVHAGLQLPQPWEVIPVEAILWRDSVRPGPSLSRRGKVDSSRQSPCDGVVLLD